MTTLGNRKSKNERRLPAAYVLAAMLLCQPFAARAQQPLVAAASGHADEEVISVTTRLVGVTVELGDGVRDEQSVRALRIEADGVRHSPSFAALDGGANVALVVDMSTSMRGRKASRAREAVREFLKRADPHNRYSLIVFNGSVKTLGEFGGDEQGRRALDEALGGEHAGGETVLYDACLTARDIVARMASGRSKRALVVFTDGLDTRSKTPLAALDRGLNSLGGLVYLVVLGSGVQDESPYRAGLDPYNEGVARELAQATRGEAYPARSANKLMEASKKVAGRLNRTAHLGFYPAGAAARPGTHTLSVFGPGGKALRARARYFIDGEGAEPEPDVTPALTAWQQAIREVEGGTPDALVFETALRRRAPELSPEARLFYKKQLFDHPDLANTEVLDSDTEEATRVREIILPTLKTFDRTGYEVVIIRQESLFIGIWRECIIVLSSSMAEFLTPKQLRAAVAHDLAHECFIGEMVEADRLKKSPEAYHLIEHKCDLVAALAIRAQGETPFELAAAVGRIEKHQREHPDPRLDTSRHPPAKDRKLCIQVFLARLHERAP